MSEWFIKYSSEKQPKLRLFCFPPAGGSASEFREWCNYFCNEIEILSLQLPGRETRFSQPLVTDFTDLIIKLHEEIKNLLDIPYVFFGHSLGALISFELIHSLREKNLPLPCLFIASAKEAPHCHVLPKEQDIWNDKWLIERLKSYASMPEDFIVSLEFKEVFLPYIRADFLLLSSYISKEHPLLNLPIIALQGNNDLTTQLNKVKAWEKHTQKSFNFHTFAGGHFFIRESKGIFLQFLTSELSLNFYN